jgi:hypothetical protein
VSAIDQNLQDLPGGDLINQGLQDLAAGQVTIAACLVFIAFPKLSRAGLIASNTTLPALEGEKTLYRLLHELPGDPYSRYNSLLRELVSFEHAIDARRA